MPCPSDLAVLLREHLEQFGTAPDGRLFTGECNAGALPKLTINRSWQRARDAVFGADAASSPLARTPYALRHAAVSTWLTAGVPSTTVAAWAGRSVEVLLKIYAKCLDGGEGTLHERVQAVLNG